MDLASLGGFTDEDFKRTIVRALRLLGVLSVVAMALFWWKAGWQSAALVAVGALISGSGLWEWLRLMSAVMERMDEGAKARPMGQNPGEGNEGALPDAPIRVQPMGQTLGDESEVALPDAPVKVQPMGQTLGEGNEGSLPDAPVKVQPMGLILFGFFLRLGLTVVVLYVSLKYLNGSVLALAAGLGLGIFSLTVEGLRLLKAWTV